MENEETKWRAHKSGSCEEKRMALIRQLPGVGWWLQGKENMVGGWIERERKRERKGERDVHSAKLLPLKMADQSLIYIHTTIMCFFRFF